MNPILEAVEIHKSFGNVQAVKGLTLSVKAGECLALLGPNGAGKTTTVEILEGLQKPDRGTVRIFGRELASDHRAIMENVGVMLQETQLYKKMTVRETLSLFASFYKSSLPVNQILDLVDLHGKADVRLEKLSGGQKQRCYLGCALINDPTLMFLDEPTTGLDPQSRRAIWELLKSRKGQDKGILLTTHYMDEAEYLADRVAIVDHGTIIAEGSPRDLIRSHCGEQVVSFSLAQPCTRDDLTNRIPEWGAIMMNPSGEFEMVTSNPVATIEKLYAVVPTLSNTLVHLEMRRSTLEDVFLKLTGRRIRHD